MISQEETQVDDSTTKTNRYLSPGTYNVPLKNSPEQRSVEDPDNEVHTEMLKDKEMFKYSLEVDDFLPNSSGSDILSRTGSNAPVTTQSYSGSHSSLENNSDFSLKANWQLEELRDNKINERYPSFKGTTSGWEYRKGKLTDYTIKTMKQIFADLKRTYFAAYVTKKLDFKTCTDAEIDNPTNMNTIVKKLNEKYYTYLSEFVHDIRHIIIYPNPYSQDRRYVMHLELFKNTFNDLLKEEFPDVDFQYITGKRNESLGLFSLKPHDAKETDENGGD